MVLGRLRLTRMVAEMMVIAVVLDFVRYPEYMQHMIHPNSLYNVLSRSTQEYLTQVYNNELVTLTHTSR